MAPNTSCPFPSPTCTYFATIGFPRSSLGVEHRSDNRGESGLLLGGPPSHEGTGRLACLSPSWAHGVEVVGPWGVMTAVEGLAEAAPETVGSLSWGKDPKDCGMLDRG